MNLKLLALSAMFLFTNIAQAESEGKIISDAVKIYKNYKELTKDPEETDLQRAGRHATPSMARNKVVHKRQVEINKCHKENDVIFWGSTFRSTKCADLEAHKYDVDE